MIADEADKLQLYLNEARKLGLQHPHFVSQESFFRLWQENCSPKPFVLPKTGLTLAGRRCFAEAWQKAEEQGVAPIVHADWWPGTADDPVACARVICDIGTSSTSILLPLANHGQCTPRTGPAHAPHDDQLQGENLEVMFDVANHLKSQYPGLNLNSVKDKIICQALRELGDALDPLAQKRLLRYPASRRRELLQHVIEQMAQDEVDTQLTLQFDVTSPLAPDLPTPQNSVLPPRGLHDIKLDLELLLDTETEILNQERDILIRLDVAKILTPLTPEQTQIVSVPLSDAILETLREGLQLFVFPFGDPRNRLATLTADIIEQRQLIGTLAWQSPESIQPLNAQLFAAPRKSAHEFIVRALKSFQQQFLRDEPQPFPALNALLGRTAATFTFLNRRDLPPQLDASQSQAVATCLHDDNPVTIIHGPPGTGKTTVIETLVRHLARQGKRILLTAPSNAAVDNICRRLLDLPLLRYANHQDSIALDLQACWYEAPEAVAHFQQKCTQQAGEIHASTHVGLLKAPAIVDTATPFDVIIFDEAGMTRTAEALLCLCLAKRACFFGDPLQLSPFPLAGDVRQAVQQRHPAITSAQKCFISDGILTWLQVHRHFPTIMLQICYRCQNPRLMRFASLLFYNGQIKPNTQAAYFKLPWKERLRQFPPQTIQIISTSQLPAETRREELVLEGRTPGYVNVAEARICVQLVRQKLEQFPLKELAIISPYRKQIKLIREMLKECQPTDCSENDWKRFRHTQVSTIDSFQGSEADVVIISYVRSGGSSVGFIDDPNRVNVTHTRAKREMFVVGDIDFLKQHAHDRIFLRLARNILRDGIVTQLHDLTD